MNEATRADRWLHARLTGDAPLMADAAGGAHYHPAPRGTTGRFVTFQLQASTDATYVGARRVWANLLYLIRVIGQGRSFVELEAAADRIDALFHDVSGVVGDGRVISSTRESVFSLAEERDGVEYRHLGGLYRLLVQPLNA